MKKYRGMVLSFLVTGLLVLGLEAVARYHFYKSGESSAAGIVLPRQKYLNSFLKFKGNGLHNGYREWENELVVHPFFGLVYNPKNPQSNSFGFNSKYDFALCGNRYCLKDQISNPLVIGILGGSFAEGVGLQSDYLEEKIKKIFPDKTPVVINFAIGGHAMPQAYFIYNYFSEMLDAAVFLDGANELYITIENNKTGFPPEYARAFTFNYKLSLMEITPGNWKLTNSITTSRSLLLSLTKLSLWPGLRNSFLLYYMWKLCQRGGERKIQNAMSEIQKSYQNQRDFFEISEEKMLDFAASNWEKYHQKIHRLAQAEGVLDIHLLQPNPYAKNSKHLTLKEKDRIRNAFYFIAPYMKKGYPLLVNRVASLRKSGMIAEDLSSLFDEVKGDIWVDSFHANELGIKQTSDEIVRIIAEEAKHNPSLFSKAAVNSSEKPRATSLK